MPMNFGSWCPKLRSLRQARTFASASRPPIEVNSRLRKRLFVAGGLVVASGIVYQTVPTVHDGVGFTMHALQRSYTVTSAVSRCMWHYYWFLNANFPDEESRERALSETHLRCAKIARKAIEHNRGLFIKIGQHISALTYMFPDEWTESMKSLQDQAPVSSYESVEQLFRDDLHQEIKDMFSYFEPKPFGTASLAQVHKAKLIGGQDVAVKVQHPSLKVFIPLDVALIRHVFGALDYFFPEYPFTWLSDEIQRSVYNELDFREEAKNAMNTAEYFEPFYYRTALKVPKVYWAERRLLCMEFASGGRPDDLKFLDENHIDRADLSSCFAHIFNNMIFTPGVGLHCDPHAGNIAIRPLSVEEQRERHSSRNFEIILYDHGLYRYVPTPTRRTYSHLWLALMANDQEATRKYAKEFAKVNDDEFNIFAAAITGRAFDQAVSGVMTKRSDEEKEFMVKAIQEQHLFGAIIRLLNRLPPIVLLILKTNDLTRYLDEKLDSPLGVVRSFLIMAQYCAKTVYDEQWENTKAQYTSVLNPLYWCSQFGNWLQYVSISSKLAIYDFVMWIRPQRLE